MSTRSWFGIALAIGLCVALEVVLQETAGVSFTAALLTGSSMPVLVFVAGCILGMAWDYLGIIALHLWRYPPAERHPWFYLVLPLFWGIFMFILQDGYAVARLLGLGAIPAVVLSTLILGALMEGANLHTYSWKYIGPASSIPFLAIGWILGLGFVYVTGFNTFFINPFGL